MNSGTRPTKTSSFSSRRPWLILRETRSTAQAIFLSLKIPNHHNVDNSDGRWDYINRSIEFSGIGGGGGVMDKIAGHLTYNLDTVTAHNHAVLHSARTLRARQENFVRQTQI